MARIRSVRPDYFTDEGIVELSRDARLHNIGLWTVADDEGRGLDNPKLLKGAIWALDDEVTPSMVEGWQAELEAGGHLLRYEVAGRRYFQVVAFRTFQKPQKPQPSKLPEPPTPVALRDESCSATGVVAYSSATSPVALPPAETDGESVRVALRDVGVGVGVEVDVEEDVDPPIVPPLAQPSTATPAADAEVVDLSDDDERAVVEVEPRSDGSRSSRPRSSRAPESSVLKSEPRSARCARCNGRGEVVLDDEIVECTCAAAPRVGVAHVP